MLRNILELLLNVQIAQVSSFSSVLINRFHCKSKLVCIDYNDDLKCTNTVCTILTFNC